MPGLYLSLLFFWLSPDHALYLSLIEIEKQENRTSLTIKVFIDDYQDALKNFKKDKVVFISDETFPVDNTTLTKDYFRTYLKLSGGSQTIDLKFVKSEMIGDSYQLEFSFDEPWTELQIEATYFTELFPTQQNIVIASDGNVKRSCRLHKQEPSCSLKF